MATKNEIFQFVKNSLYDIGISNSEEITEEMSLKNDIGLDSLDSAEFIMKCENEFKITIPDNEFATLETVGDTINLIIKYLKYEKGG